MFSLEKGCGDCVFLAAAILKLLFFYDLFLIIHFSNTFFKIFVVPEGFSAKDTLLGGGEERGAAHRQENYQNLFTVDFDT